MELRKLLFVSALGLVAAGGLAACKSETEVHNEGASGTANRPAEVRTTKETVRVQGETDDPKDHDQDRVETHTRTEVDR